MMTIEKKIQAIGQLREFILYMVDHEFEDIAYQCFIENPWFSEENVRQSLEGILFMIEDQKVKKWLEPYTDHHSNSQKNIGLILAGNIPAVGFHDLLSVFASPHKAIVKTSHQDKFLIDLFIKKLNEFSDSEKLIKVEKISGIDATIATGSSNSSRYFNYYFGKYPNIIRSNRTSIAILDGNESDEEIIQLGTDVFSYFGLGCRNVSKIFIPEGFDLVRLGDIWQKFSPLAQHNKFANNYDYQKSIHLVNKIEHLDYGYLLVKRSEDLFSPIGMLLYETYSRIEDVSQRIEKEQENIQCIVGNQKFHNSDLIPFGRAQKPELWNYADNKNTLDFLYSL